MFIQTLPYDPSIPESREELCSRLHTSARRHTTMGRKLIRNDLRNKLRNFKLCKTQKGSRRLSYQISSRRCPVKLLGKTQKGFRCLSYPTVHKVSRKAA